MDNPGTHILDEGRAVAVQLPGGRELRYHAIWLRDNALDETTRSPGNGQRLIRLTDIPEDTRVETADVEDDQLRIGFGPDGKTVSYPLAWLLQHDYDGTRETQEIGWLARETETWSADDAQGVPLRSDYSDLSTDPGQLRRWLTALKRHGAAMLVGGPLESGSLLKLVGLFGYPRETNYGTWFEVRSEPAPSNLAYTADGLQAHTDNPYRDPIPTLQILYCLEDAADGGESFIVDGFRAAQELRKESPQDFQLLSSYCARFEYAGSTDVILRSRKPMIELAPDGELIALRFNNRSAAPVVDVPYDLVPDYYRAYRHLSEIIDRPSMAIEFKLAPGEAFVVDNTRVLHGRRGFTANGGRWLQGCYADKDAALSKLSVSERETGA